MKTKTKRKTLNQVLKGMILKNWEIREYDDGRRVVHVHYTEVSGR